MKDGTDVISVKTTAVEGALEVEITVLRLPPGLIHVDTPPLVADLPSDITEALKEWLG